MGVRGLQISTRETGDVTILDLRGRATIGFECELLRSRLKDLVAHGVRKLLLNLADVNQVDSYGLGVIAETSESLRGQGGSLKFLRPNSRVLTVLQVTHVLEIIPSFDDEAKALASFQARGYAATP
jgi:anti-anti-sigma factor